MKPTNEEETSAGQLLPGTGQHKSFGDCPPAAAMEGVISLLDIWRILMRYRVMILGVVLACTLASTVLALVMTPVYRAEIQVVPVSEKDSNSRFAAQLGELGGLASLSGINTEQGGKKNESIATLRSRKFTEQFIKDEKLLPVLFYDKWDAEPWRVIDGIEFRSVTLTATKPLLADDRTGNKSIMYRGPFAAVTDDAGNTYTRGQRVPLTDRTHSLLLSAYDNAFIDLSANSGISESGCCGANIDVTSGSSRGNSCC